MNILSHSKPVGNRYRIILDFDDNSSFASLLGRHDENIVEIENELDVSISARGNRLSIEGQEDDCALAKSVVEALYERASAGDSIGQGEILGAVRMAQGGGDTDHVLPDPQEGKKGAGSVSIMTRRRVITPRSPAQAAYMTHLDQDEMVFGIGPAGTGKTYLAVATAVSHLLRGEVDRVIISRPAVEAGESLGFLPGDMREKVDPYLRPIYDALHDMMPHAQVEKRLENGQIEVAPLAFMRGRTLSNAYIILDEAQNTTPMQMKMFLTRFGENSRMVIAGDPSQGDLPQGTRSGLLDALDVLGDVKGVSIIRFGSKDVVRHPLVGRIVAAYDKQEKKAPANRSKGRNRPD